MPTFSSDWFSHNIPHWLKIFSEIRWDPHSVKTVLEIGSFEGRSTLWIAANLLKHPNSRLYCVDTFEAPIEGRQRPVSGLLERFSANIAESPDSTKILARHGRSLDLIHDLLSKGIGVDFVYIDGSHLATDVLQDLVMSFQILKVRGLMICDDYLWSMERPGSEDVLNSPKIAIDAFTTIFRRKISILPRQPLYQLAILKTAE